MRRILLLCCTALVVSSCSLLDNRTAPSTTTGDAVADAASTTTTPIVPSTAGGDTPPAVAAGEIVNGVYRIPVSGVATQESFCAAFVAVQHATNPSDTTVKRATWDLIAPASAIANNALAAFAPEEIAPAFEVYAEAQAMLFQVFEEHKWDAAYVAENMSTLVTDKLTPEINNARNTLFSYCSYDPRPGGAPTTTTP